MNSGPLEIHNSKVNANRLVMARMGCGYSNCAEADGGGISSTITGDLSIGGSEISGNEIDCKQDGICYGGGISAVELTVTNSTIRGNRLGITEQYYGAGGGGGIKAARLTLSDSTVSGNIVTCDLGLAATMGQSGKPDCSGGGVWASELSAVNSTITSNRASEGCGGIYVEAGHEVSNVILANHGPDCCGIGLSLGHNLDSDGTCGLDQPTDLPGTDPMLGKLQDNHGPTWTHLPMPGSPVIDAGSCGSTTDQRGVPRPIDGNGDTLALCDIGAVEFFPPCDDPDAPFECKPGAFEREGNVEPVWP
jgi:hypothetical protein